MFLSSINEVLREDRQQRAAMAQPSEKAWAEEDFAAEPARTAVARFAIQRQLQESHARPRIRHMAWRAERAPTGGIPAMVLLNTKSSIGPGVSTFPGVGVVAATSTSQVSQSLWMATGTTVTPSSLCSDVGSAS
jgi:hypothetical protein